VFSSKSPSSSSSMSLPRSSLRRAGGGLHAFGWPEPIPARQLVTGDEKMIDLIAAKRSSQAAAT
jgi:hypothetical protein